MEVDFFLHHLRADFLEHVPCMSKVKGEYQKCTDNYNSHMARLTKQKEQELRALVEASTTTTMPPVTTDKSSKRFTVSSIRKVKRQHDVKENTIAARDSTSHHQNSSSTSSDNGNEQIKTVCW